MGWLFSDRWPTRADLVTHLTLRNGLKTIKHCLVGNNLWCVHEYMQRGMVCRYVCLYKMKPHGKGYDGWGYKDIDESMGPCETSCPVSYLNMCTAPEGTYAYEWRQRVYARDRKLKSMQFGKRIQYGDVIYEIIQRLRGGGFKVASPHGTIFRMTPRQVACAVEV